MTDALITNPGEWIVNRPPAQKLPCQLCGGQGWLHFSCGTPWRCKCNRGTEAYPRYLTTAYRAVSTPTGE